MLADSFYAGNQAADPADYQINGNTFAGGPVKRFDGFPVYQGVHFHNYPPVPFFFVPLYFAVNHFDYFLAGVDRRNNQLSIGCMFRVSGQSVEQFRHIVCKQIVCGQVTVVGINFCRNRIIVTGTEMQIPLQLVMLLANNQRQFRVCFKTDKSIHHVCADIFKRPCPADIVFFVETRLQFNKNRNLFALLHGVHKRLYYRRIAAYTVKGLLDGKYMWVICRLVDKIDNGLKRVVGMVQQLIPLTYRAEDIASHLLFDRIVRSKRLVLELRLLDAHHLHEVARPKGTGYLIKAFRIDFEVFYQNLPH